MELDKDNNPYDFCPSVRNHRCLSWRLPQHPEGLQRGGRPFATGGGGPFAPPDAMGWMCWQCPAACGFLPLQGIAGGRTIWRLLLSDDVILSYPYAGPLGELGDLYLLFAVDAGGGHDWDGGSCLGATVSLPARAGLDGGHVAPSWVPPEPLQISL